MLPKEVKDLYSENSKKLMKETEMTQTDGKIYSLIQRLKE